MLGSGWMEHFLKANVKMEGAALGRKCAKKYVQGRRGTNGMRLLLQRSLFICFFFVLLPLVVVLGEAVMRVAVFRLALGVYVK